MRRSVACACKYQGYIREEVWLPLQGLGAKNKGKGKAGKHAHKNLWVD